MAERKLVITKDSAGFVVDEPAAPGSPYIGSGRTIDAALGSWFKNNSHGLGFVITSKGEAVKSVNDANKRLMSKR